MLFIILEKKELASSSVFQIMKG